MSSAPAPKRVFQTCCNLAEAEVTLGALLAGAEVTLVAVDEGGCIGEVSGQSADSLQLQTGEVFRERIAVEDRERFDQARTALPSRGGIPLQLRLRDPMGSWRFVGGTLLLARVHGEEQMVFAFQLLPPTRDPMTVEAKNAAYHAAIHDLGQASIQTQNPQAMVGELLDRVQHSMGAQWAALVRVEPEFSVIDVRGHGFEWNSNLADLAREAHAAHETRSREVGTGAWLLVPFRVDQGHMAVIVHRCGPFTRGDAAFLKTCVDFYASACARTDAEERWRQIAQILEVTPDVVGTIDETGAIVYLNQAGRRLWNLGDDPGPFPPGTVATAPEWARRKFYEEALPALRKGQVWHGSMAVLNRDGEEIEVSQVVVPLYSAGRLYFTTVLRDVSDLRHADRVAREAVAQKALALDSKSTGTWTFDVASGKFECDANMVRLFDADLSGKRLGDALLERVHPDDQERAAAEFREAIAAGGEVSVAFRVIHGDGAVRSLLVKGRLLEGSPKEPTRFVGLAHDFTDELEAVQRARQLERERDELQSWLDLMVERVPVGCVVCDAEGRFTAFSSSAERIFGFSRKDVIGTHPTENIVAPEARDTVQEVLRRLAAGEVLAPVEHQNIRKDGERIHVRWIDTPLFGRDGRYLGFIGFAQDITQEHEAQQAVEDRADLLETHVAARTQELREANKALAEEVRQHLLTEAELRASNADLELFAHTIAHDLKAPLRSMAGFARILAEDYGPKLDGEAREYLETIVEGSRRMGMLLDDLLAFARLSRDRFTPEPVSLPEVVRRVAQVLRPEIEASGAVLTTDALPVFMGNRSAIEQIVQNLVGNAIKFQRSGVPPVVSIRAEHLDNGFVLQVKDNGIGIKSEFLDRIFRPFERLHPRSEYPGTGMGLAIVRKAVEVHHGRVWVHSTPGEGSEFSVWLPDVAGETI